MTGLDTPTQAEAGTDLEPRQRTVGDTVRIEGVGLMLGQPVSVEIHPAPPETGIVFERVDLDPPVRIPATVDRVVSRARRTTLKTGEATIETIEHCMSALAGLQIDNAVIELTPENMAILLASEPDAAKAAAMKQDLLKRLKRV